MKQKVLNPEEVFFLNLDENLNFYAKSAGFDFEIVPMSLYEEASMSMYVIRMAKELLEHPEYASLIETVEYPDLTNPEKIEFRPVDISKLSDLKYIIGYLPQNFATLVDNVAFFNKVVKGITKNGKRVAVRDPHNSENTIVIENFLDFVKYVKGKNIHLQLILEDLYKQYSDWEKETAVDPIEVKN